MRGADVRCGGFAVLLAAADLGHELPITKLIEAGVNIHAWSEMALLRSSKLGHLGTVKILIGAGAYVNVEKGWPLEAAAEFGHADICHALIAAGADVTLTGRRGGALFSAAKNRAHIIRILMSGGLQVFSEDYCAEALRIAAGNGHNNVVLLMIEKGVDVTLREDAALYSAAANGRDDVVRTLIAAGARHLNEALTAAQVWGRGDVTKILLQLGASPPQTRIPRTPNSN